MISASVCARMHSLRPNILDYVLKLLLKLVIFTNSYEQDVSCVFFKNIKFLNGAETYMNKKWMP